MAELRDESSGNCAEAEKMPGKSGGRCGLLGRYRRLGRNYWSTPWATSPAALDPRQSICWKTSGNVKPVISRAGPPATRRAHQLRGEPTSYAASSMAKIAVSGWLIGSTPTLLTMPVIVPSASASTHAARCSRPR